MASQASEPLGSAPTKEKYPHVLTDTEFQLDDPLRSRGAPKLFTFVVELGEGVTGRRYIISTKFCSRKRVTSNAETEGYCMTKAATLGLGDSSCFVLTPKRKGANCLLNVVEYYSASGIQNVVEFYSELRVQVNNQDLHKKKPRLIICGEVYKVTVSSSEQQPCTISLEGNKHAQRLLVVQGEDIEMRPEQKITSIQATLDMSLPDAPSTAVPQKKSKHQRRAKKMSRKIVDEADVPSPDRKQPERAAKKYRDHVMDEEEDEVVVYYAASQKFVVVLSWSCRGLVVVLSWSCRGLVVILSWS
eukprot:g45213.t1